MQKLFQELPIQFKNITPLRRRCFLYRNGLMHSLAKYYIVRKLRHVDYRLAQALKQFA